LCERMYSALNACAYAWKLFPCSPSMRAASSCHAAIASTTRARSVVTLAATSSKLWQMQHRVPQVGFKAWLQHHAQGQIGLA